MKTHNRVDEIPRCNVLIKVLTLLWQEKTLQNQDGPKFTARQITYSYILQNARFPQGFLTRTQTQNKTSQNYQALWCRKLLRKPAADAPGIQDL